MLSDLVFALAKRGHEITVVTTRLRYDDPLARFSRRETMGGVEVIRVATTGFGRSGLVGRAADYLTFFAAAAFTLLWRARRGDVIVAKTDPPLLSIVTSAVAWMRGACPVNWLQDIYPEVATILGVGQGGVRLLLLALLRRLRNRALRTAALNVVIGKRMATVLGRLGVSPDRVCVIPNWADGDLVRPVLPEENALRRGWALGNSVVVGYSGNLGRAHDAETMLAAIALTEAADVADAGSLPLAVGARLVPRAAAASPIAWLFVGGGAQFAKLRSMVEQRGHHSVHFQPYQPRARLAESLSVPDIHLISLRPELEGLIVPSKFYGIAAAGRPAIFIGDPNGEIGRILTETGTGLTVAESDGAGLARAVRTLAENPRRAAEMGRRARALFEARYDVRFAVEAWDEAIRALQP